MSLTGLLPRVASDGAIRAALDDPDAAELDLTGPAGFRPFVLAALSAGLHERGRTQPIIAVTSSGRDADDLVDALASLLPADTVTAFPSWETLPHEKLSPRADTVGRRLAVLRRLAHPSEDGQLPLRVVVTPIRSILQPVVAGLGDLEPTLLTAGDTIDFDELVSQLVEKAYTRVELVARRGELAVRGGILDVFPPTEEHPLRLEFFGDEIEEIRHFAVSDQRSLGVAKSLYAPPCRELLLTPAVRQRAHDLLDAHPELEQSLAKIADGIPVEGMEALAPVLADRMVLLLEEIAPGSHLVLCDPERIRLRAHDLVRTSQEFLEAS